MKHTTEHPEWTEDLKTGNIHIDAQHHSLFQLLDQIVDDISPNHLHKLLERLEEYAHVHFYDEEQIQVEVNYPEFNKHTELHHDFLVNLQSLREKVEEGTYSGYVRIKQFTVEWLRDHILNEDQKFIKFYQSQTEEQ